jgi:DNA-3-methyladenine glycosylase II
MELVTDQTLSFGVHYLCQKDQDLHTVINLYGYPPLWNRKPGFASLLRIILEQQVSLASAAACYGKLEDRIGEIIAESVLRLHDSELREIGFSRQKAAYARNLAQLIVAGEINLPALQNKTDDEVRQTLIRVRGIGHWTIDIYLLMALQRPDIWPDGDLALITALAQLKNMDRSDVRSRAKAISAEWAPWRSVAARILWHFYLSDGKAEKRLNGQSGKSIRK